MTDNHQNPTPDPTKTPDPSLIGTEVNPPAVVEFVPDTTKSAEENAAAKIVFDKTASDAAAAKKVEDEKKAAEATKTEAEKKAAEDAAKANDTKANPFKVEEIKLPEGMQIDAPIAEKFVGVVNKFGLGRDAVAELTALQAEAMKNVSEAGSKLYADMQETWRNEAKADTVIGGEKLAPVLGNVAKVVDRYGTPALRGVFDLTGAGNNLEVIKFINNIYSDLGEAHFVPSDTPSTGSKDQASILYPNQGKT